MATTKEFHDYIMDSLLNLRIGEFTSKKMMGEYCVYFNNKLIGDICDNVFLLKPTASVLRLLPDADRAYPYEGSKTFMVVAGEIDDVELFSQVIKSMYDELPEKKK